MKTVNAKHLKLLKNSISMSSIWENCRTKLIFCKKRPYKSPNLFKFTSKILTSPTKWQRLLELTIRNSKTKYRLWDKHTKRNQFIQFNLSKDFKTWNELIVNNLSSSREETKLNKLLWSIITQSLKKVLTNFSNNKSHTNYLNTTYNK